MILVLAAVVWLMSPEGQFLASRLRASGTDSASLSRIEMLATVPDAFASNPVGYGEGNGIRAVERLIGDVRAGNLHNVFAQNALDFGIQGLILWGLINIRICRSFLTGHRATSVSLSLVVFLTMSLVQFTGLEPYAWLLFGLLDDDSRRGNVSCHSEGTRRLGSRAA
jgi:O-antigen ligase